MRQFEKAVNGLISTNKTNKPAQQSARALRSNANVSSADTNHELSDNNSSHSGTDTEDDDGNEANHNTNNDEVTILASTRASEPHQFQQERDEVANEEAVLDRLRENLAAKQSAIQKERAELDELTARRERIAEEQRTIREAIEQLDQESITIQRKKNASHQPSTSMQSNMEQTPELLVRNNISKTPQYLEPTHRLNRGLQWQNNESQQQNIIARDDGQTKKFVDTRHLQFFSGKEEDDLDEWRFELERYYKKANILPKDKVDFAVDYLKGSAKQFYRSIPDIDELSWNEFMHLMRQNYEPRNKQEHYRLKLESLKQNKSIEDYISQFDSIAIRIRNMSSYDMTRNFIRNLKPRTRELVEASDPTDIYEAKSKALRVDSYELVKSQQLQQQQFNRNSDFRNSKNNYHQQFSQNDQPQKNQDRHLEYNQFRKPTNKCHYCGLDWHRDHRCLRNKRQLDSSS